MLDLKQIESFYPEPLRPFKRNLLREYLQYKILEAIYLSKFSEKLSFMGGTAIHIIHSNARFSEDLDFDNLGLTREEFTELTEIVKRRMNLEGYEVEIRNSFRQAYRARINIKNLLYESGLSSHKEEKMPIHLDVEPQKFKYKPDKVIINKFDIFTKIYAVPIEVLLSQKIYAILMRRRPMGRDFYDAIFLFGKTKPDMDYLKVKLASRDWPDIKTMLLKRCENLDFGTLAEDVRHFLFNPSDAGKVSLFCEYIQKYVW